MILSPDEKTLYVIPSGEKKMYSYEVKSAGVLGDAKVFCELEQAQPNGNGGGDGLAIDVKGNPNFPVNEGGLCVKGWSAAATLGHPDRLRAPLVRDRKGRLIESSWHSALRRVADRIQVIQRKHGADAVAVLGGGSLTNEKAYWLGKFARVALGTANIDYNGRFCM